jgi:hypothetical protein
MISLDLMLLPCSSSHLSDISHNNSVPNKTAQNTLKIDVAAYLNIERQHISRP